MLGWEGTPPPPAPRAWLPARSPPHHPQPHAALQAGASSPTIIHPLLPPASSLPPSLPLLSPEMRLSWAPKANTLLSFSCTSPGAPSFLGRWKRRGLKPTLTTQPGRSRVSGKRSAASWRDGGDPDTGGQGSSEQTAAQQACRGAPVAPRQPHCEVSHTHTSTVITHSWGRMCACVLCGCRQAALTHPGAR